MDEKQALLNLLRNTKILIEADSKRQLLPAYQELKHSCVKELNNFINKVSRPGFKISLTPAPFHSGPQD